MIVFLTILLLLQLLPIIPSNTNNTTTNTTNVLDAIEKWRNEYKPELIDFYNDIGIQYEYNKQYVYIYKQSLTSIPIIYFNITNYNKIERNYNNVKLLTIWLLNEALSLSLNNNIIIIIDINNFTIKKHVDIDMINMVLYQLQNSLILNKIIILKSSYIFKLVWNMISNLLNNDTKSKVVFLDNTDLSMYVDYDNLPIGFRYEHDNHDKCLS
jgi:hypothetical protein